MNMAARNATVLLLLLASLVNAQGIVRPGPAGKLNVDSINPSTIAADGEAYAIQIDGQGFSATNTSVAINGAGVSVGNVTFISDRRLLASMTAAVGAAETTRTITVTRGPRSSGLEGLTVVAPESESISLLSIAPDEIEQDSTAELVVFGAAIQDGCTVTVSGSGVTAAVTGTAPTSVRADFTATAGAALGLRSVTVTNPDMTSATLTDVLEVVATATPPASDYIIDQAWLDFYGPAPYYLDQAGKTYELAVNVTTDGSAFGIIADDITFDLGGYTVTPGNAAPIALANGSFESDLSGNWDLTGALNADRFNGLFLSSQVHIGDYSLRFQTPCEDQYVESVGTITLQPLTTYCFAGMLQRGNVTNGNPNTFTMWCELVGQSGETTRRFEKTTGNNRGIQYTDTVFTTGATEEIYKVRIGVTNSATASSGAVYFDDIRVMRPYCHGVCVAVRSGAAEFYPGFTQYGTAANAIVKNGTIVQGQDNGYQCAGVFAYQSNPYTIQDLSITVQGPNCNNIWAQAAGVGTVDTCVLTSNVVTIRSRDSFDGSMIGNSFRGEVVDCEFYNGPHMGVRSANATGNSVHGCTFAMKNRFTNGFAIGIRGSGAQVYSNTITNTGIYNGRGIQVNGTAAANMVVHTNTVSVQSLPLNQEYAGSLIAWGIQCEGTGSAEIYNNTVTAVGDQGEASAMRLNNNPNSCHIHDNIFIADQDTAGVEVSCIAIQNVHGDLGNNFVDNELRTNKNFAGNINDNCSDILWNRTTFTLLGTPSVDARYFESESSATNQSQAIDGWEWRDPVYTSAAEEAIVEGGSWRRTGTAQYGRWDRYSVTWTATAHVTNSGSPVNGASVNFTDGLATIQASGTTDSNGDYSAVVPEFEISGNTVDTTSTVLTEYNDYTVNVTAPYADSATATIDSVETVNVVN